MVSLFFSLSFLVWITTMKRLKYVLCRKAGSSEASTGIRPLLLDLQLVPRDDDSSGTSASPLFTIPSSTLEERIDQLIGFLSILSSLVKTKNAFATTKLSSSGGQSSVLDTIEFSVLVENGCTEDFDQEMMKCLMLDWFAMVDQQQQLQQAHKDLPEEIRCAEMKMSIAGASAQSLQMVKERLAAIQLDRQQRFEVLKEMVEEICLREMNLFVQLTQPASQERLELKEVSTPGFLGIPLQQAGESLPLG
jgi:preprotein translocase subunit YajC